MTDPFLEAEQRGWEMLKPFMSEEQFQQLSAAVKEFALAEVDRITDDLG